jgi:hypothetical protein
MGCEVLIFLLDCWPVSVAHAGFEMMITFPLPRVLERVLDAILIFRTVCFSSADLIGAAGSRVTRPVQARA